MKVKNIFLYAALVMCLLFPVGVSAKQPVQTQIVENYKNFLRAKVHKPIEISIKYNTITKNERKYMYEWTHVRGTTGYEHQVSPDKNFRKNVHKQTGSAKWAGATMEYVCNLHDTPCKTVHQNYYIRIRPLFGKYHGRWSKIAISKGDL